MDKIRILLADDHAVVRDGLKAALEIEPHIEIIGEANNGKEAVELAKELRPDIVVMDMNMPILDGVGASRKIKEDLPGIKIMILTMHDNKQFILDALSAGIDSYMLKMARIEEVHKAINALADGDNYYDKSVTEIILGLKKQENSLGFGENRFEDLLTAREREITTFIIKGLTTVEIAEKLTISPNTVKNHRSAVIKKIGVKNVAELVKLAFETGFIKF